MENALRNRRYSESKGQPPSSAVQELADLHFRGVHRGGQVQQRDVHPGLLVNEFQGGEVCDQHLLLPAQHHPSHSSAAVHVLHPGEGVVRLLPPPQQTVLHVRIPARRSHQPDTHLRHQSQLLLLLTVQGQHSHSEVGSGTSSLL